MITYYLYLVGEEERLRLYEESVPTRPFVADGVAYYLKCIKWDRKTQSSLFSADQEIPPCRSRGVHR
jgi:hypothetical protein